MEEELSDDSQSEQNSSQSEQNSSQNVYISEDSSLDTCSDNLEVDDFEDEIDGTDLDEDDFEDEIDGTDLDEDDFEVGDIDISNLDDDFDFDNDEFQEDFEHDDDNNSSHNVSESNSRNLSCSGLSSSSPSSSSSSSMYFVTSETPNIISFAVNSQTQNNSVTVPTEEVKPVSSAAPVNETVDQVFQNTQTSEVLITAENIKELQEENRKLKEAQDCKICLEQRIAIAFEPCGHSVTCANCGLKQQIERCPICRKRIKKRLRIFLA